MSQSAGAGSPLWFMCPRVRKIYDYALRYFESKHHNITLTGNTRRYKTNFGSALGVRSTATSREYQCSCGYVGWSNHIDLARMENQSERHG